MAQFRGTIAGQRGEASRLGSKNSGLVVTANGWDTGVRVVARHVDGEDVFDVFATGGSNAHRPSEHLFTITAGATFIANRVGAK